MKSQTALALSIVISCCESQPAHLNQNFLIKHSNWKIAVLQLCGLANANTMYNLWPLT